MQAQLSCNFRRVTRLGGTGLVILSALVLAGVGGSAPSGTAGDIDTTFGVNGAVLASISTYGAEAEAVVVQPDGKIVLAGSTRPPPPPPLPPLSPPGPPSRPAGGEIGNMDFLALRLNADGSRDSGFGSDGFVRTPIDYVPGAANWASAVALGPDGSIVLAGSALRDNTFTTDFAFVRYTSAGELDPTFSGDGIQTIGVDDYDEAFGVAVQPSDGKIVAVGRSEDRPHLHGDAPERGRDARRLVRFGRRFPHEHRRVFRRQPGRRRSHSGRNDPRGGNRRLRRGAWRLRARALPARRSARPRVR